MTTNNDNDDKEKAGSTASSETRLVTVRSETKDRPDVRRLARALISLAAAHNAEHSSTTDVTTRETRSDEATRPTDDEAASHGHLRDGGRGEGGDGR